MIRTGAIRYSLTRTYLDAKDRALMDHTKHKKFSWCPVCMVHTYHQKEQGKWVCTDKNHEDFLQYRTDPWIEQYRKSKTIFRTPVKREA
jgi:hypothetical protein